jgi:REP element-mobilizing transposase RayT
MKYNPAIHHRRSIRLQGYDYSRAGVYFVTICTQTRECLFGDVADGQMVLNDAGRMAKQCWYAIPGHFPHVGLDMFVVMPNHIHGILFIVDKPVGTKNFSLLQSKPRGTSKTPGSVIRGFKIGVTKWLRQNTEFYHIWQRNYYEYIIRNDKELNRIRQYIANNPMKWEVDRENPDIRSDTRTVCEPPLQYGNEPWQR